eukprot:280075_1
MLHVQKQQIFQSKQQSHINKPKYRRKKKKNVQNESEVHTIHNMNAIDAIGGNNNTNNITNRISILPLNNDIDTFINDIEQTNINPLELIKPLSQHELVYNISVDDEHENNNSENNHEG